MKNNIIKKIVVAAALVTTLNLALLPLCYNSAQNASNTEHNTTASKLKRGEVVEVADLIGSFTTLALGVTATASASRQCNPLIQECPPPGGVGVGTMQIPPTRL